MQITNKVVYLQYNNTNKVVITMRTENFRQAVDEIRNNGGTRETMYIKEVWKDREMTIFGYADGTAEVFESTRPYMTFNSVAEATFTLNKMQSDYDKKLEEDRARWRTNKVKINYCSLENYYGRTGVYYGD